MDPGPPPEGGRAPKELGLLSDQAEGPPPPAGLLPPRYRLLEELGRGGMGVVYRAEDTLYGREVAVKLLPPSALASQLLARFRREARDLARLSHPHVVSFYEIGEHAGQPFLVMEYVAGGNLTGYLDRAPSMADRIRVFVDVCRGLEHIHAQGLVHRDLKPANILVTPEGEPKITDFGLARHLEGETSTTEGGAILGTYQYLAPEQILSGKVGPGADLYSLGACMYLAFTGQPLFRAQSEYELLQSHVNRSPVPPRQLQPELPQALEDLILRLVAKSPGERPSSAAEVTQALLSVAGPTRPPGLPGRAAELEALESCLARVRQGQGAACLVTAASGMGRSRLLDELGVRLAARGLRVLRLIPQKEAPLTELEQIWEALAGGAEELRGCLRSQGPEGVARLLAARLARAGPAVLLADDVERLEPTARQVMEKLLLLPPPPAAGWVVSLLGSRAAGLPRQAQTLEVSLGPLPEPEARHLVASLWGGPVDAELTGWMLARAGGSPRRLRLMRLALDQAVEEADQGWRQRTGVPLPARLHEALAQALEAQGEAPLRLARCAALMEEPFRFAVLQPASGLDEAQAEAALERLLHLGLLEESWSPSGDLLRFSDGPLREHLAAEGGERGRRRGHARIAQALARAGAAPGAQGRHLALAGQPAEALPLLAGAARQAAEAGAWPESLELWKLALGCVEGPAAEELRREAVHTLEQAGRPEEARALAVGPPALGEPGRAAALPTPEGRAGAPGFGPRPGVGEAPREGPSGPGMAVPASPEPSPAGTTPEAPPGGRSIPGPPAQRRSPPGAAPVAPAEGGPASRMAAPEPPYGAGFRLPRWLWWAVPSALALFLLTAGLVGGWLLMGSWTRVRISSQPSGATVRWRGREVGTTPLELRWLDLGPHTFELSKEGYRTATLEARLSPWRVPAPLWASLEPLALLVIQTTPEPAEILVDGQSRGASRRLWLDPGRHSVEVRRPGYSPHLQTVQVAGGETFTLRATLESQAPATLEVTSQPSGATVLVDGRARGRTPLSLQLEPGSHRVEVRKEGYRPHTATVRLRGQGQERLSPTLAPSPGTLVLTSEPPGARVVVNGVERGYTPLTLKNMPAKTYRIEIQRGGYYSSSRKVALGAGQTRRLAFALQALPPPPPVEPPVSYPPPGGGGPVDSGPPARVEEEPPAATP